MIAFPQNDDRPGERAAASDGEIDSPHGSTSAALVDDIRNYILCVFDHDDLVELRCIHGEFVEHDWIRARELGLHVERLRNLNSKGFNIYIGVNPRKAVGVPGVKKKHCTEQRPCGKCARCVAIFRCLFVDFDGIDVAEARHRIEQAELPAPTLLIHSGHGVHAYWRLDEPLTDPIQWRDRQQGLIAELKSDERVHDAPRILRLPGFLNVKRLPHVPCEIIECDPDRVYCIDEFPIIVRKPRKASSNGAPTDRDRMIYIEGLKLIDASRTDDYGDWLAVGMIGQTLGDDMLDVWDKWSQQSDKYEPDDCAYRWDTFDAKRVDGVTMGTLIEWVRRDTGDADFGKCRTALPTLSKADVNIPTLGKHPLADVARELSDIGNAARFTVQHGADVRWCEAWGCWIVWTNKRWERDTRRRVIELAMQTALSLFAEAASAKPDDRKAVGEHAARSQRRERLAAMLDLAKPMLPIAPNDLDADDWILNCPNGTVDLRTGELREHCREDFVTRMTRVHFDAAAHCPRLAAFMQRIFNGDRSLIDFIQRLLGHTLTGDISEQVLPVAFGAGANGKSVLFDTLLGIMGEYADLAAPDLLMQRSSDEHPTEVADLMGKRLIVASETEKGRKLRVQLVKRLTGDATLKGRFMRMDYFTFQRRFKTILVTNNKPRVTEDSEAVWRRIRLIPFAVVIPPAERDKSLTAKLIAEGPGILAWLVRGCLDWQRHGLAEPDAVKAATGEYRAESDPLRDWLADCCELDDEHAWTTTRELRQSYTAHAEERGDKPLGTRNFTDALSAHGCVARQRSEGRGWYGIRLVSEGNR